MICTALNGGLGNQLFQYAAGRQLAIRQQTELLLDDNQLSAARTRTTSRQLELHHFKVSAQPVASQHVAGLRLARRLPLLARTLTPWHVLFEKANGYDVRFESASSNTYLVGYWQSYKYFTEVASAIADDLEPAVELSDASRTFASAIDRSEAVAVHVRRGDYVSLKSAAKFHGALSLDYYASALGSMQSAVPKARFFVFSDDSSWCRANLPPLALDVVFVGGNVDLPAWEDLVLMARCRHHIIANSSFSWWGAWLADQRFGTRRRVISPLNWFVDTRRVNRDRFPLHWELL